MFQKAFDESKSDIMRMRETVGNDWDVEISLGFWLHHKFCVHDLYKSVCVCMYNL